MLKCSRVALVFAANTDCGKTLLSAGLVRAALRSGSACHYIKPVQTGYDFDEDKIKQRNPGSPPLLKTSTMVHFDTPVSPHLAATLSSASSIPSSFDIRAQLSQAVQQDATALYVVETAGGVLSPFPDGTPAAEALERFAQKSPVPVKCVLVGDGRLGGISQTLAALEALEKRRYDVASLVLFTSDEENERFGNEAYFKARFHCDPEVRRVSMPHVGQGGAELPLDFFDHDAFNQVLADVMEHGDGKDKRTLL